MRSLPASLQAHLDSGTTTLCHCWRIVRQDGAVFGFTDHDRALLFDGTTFSPESGFTASEARNSLGLAVDTVDISGALSSDTITEADLSLGLWDNARIEVYRVNWADVAQRMLLRKGSIGEIQRARSAFLAEIRGLAHVLDQESGRTYTRICDASLGDRRCGVDLTRPAYRGNGIVASAVDDRILSANGLATFVQAWFDSGVLRWTTGANAGALARISAHLRDGGGSVWLHLWQRPALAVAIGDAFTVTAGCDKTFAECRAKFGNQLNFRGFPHIPGNDFALGVAKKTMENDGGSFFS